MNINEFRNRRFLIIGGTSKAGTTSIYTYLASHPEICPSSLKETRYFLDDAYPLPKKTPFSNNLAGYAEFYSHCDSEIKILMEATPDYLYSTTALQIAEILPNARIVFILREPIDRLVSWFKYAKQKGMLSNKISFEQYVRLQLNQPVNHTTPVYLRALEQGLYIKYLAPFYEKMAGRIMVLSFESLKLSPTEMINDICCFAGLDKGHFANYEFGVHNESIAVKNQSVEYVYVSLRSMVAHFVIDNKYLLLVFRRCNRILKFLLKYNRQVHESVEISDALMGELKRYYADENIFLENLKASNSRSIYSCMPLKK